ncbi:hypothetical protein AMELA_G00207450 [Ameiurus melas]|uniref:Uncharacterized protein n=1 Tax=Ameiurus melas TaxID=219545 RepID=A0A7J6A3Q2_AMEME|nr:hypothetical protein AMELA_G00207450 [Ameiurus melas]
MQSRMTGKKKKKIKSRHRFMNRPAARAGINGRKRGVCSLRFDWLWLVRLLRGRFVKEDSLLSSLQDPASDTKRLLK